MRTNHDLGHGAGDIPCLSRKLCNKGETSTSRRPEGVIMITTWDAGRRAVMGILLAGSLALVACGEAANSQGDDGAIPTDEPRVSFQSDDGQETRTSSDLDPDGGDDADTPVGDDGRDEVAPASPDSGESQDTKL